LSLEGGELENAKISLEKAMVVAERGDMKLRKVDCLLDWVRLYMSLPDRKAAVTALDTADRLIQQMTYFRRTPELRDLRTRVAS